MKNLVFPLLLVLLTSLSVAQEKRVVSKVDSTHSPELVLIQTLTVKAPIDSVWMAFTTKKGWENWAVPVAEVNLKVGGTIKTNYNREGHIGDSTTIITHIINYVPNRLLTLQAEVSGNFPEFMKEDAKDLYNVIYFEELANGATQITSYGIGYKNKPKYLNLLKFFIPANEKTLMKLIRYLENTQ